MDEPDGLLVKGVVRNGQIVLEAPLDLPDGTFVTVTEYQVGDIPGGPWPDEPEKRQQAREIILMWAAEARRKAAARNDQEAA